MGSQADFRTKLTEYIRDAHAMEENSLLMMKSMLLHTDDSELRAIIEHHIEETQRHKQLIEGRLDALGARKGTLKEGGAIISSAFKGMLDQVRSDRPGQNARDAFVTESLEIAAYELLERFAARAGDDETAEVARRNLADEIAMRDKIASTWDKVIDLS
ncbi:MAG: ferritin-like domain-containing protein, partial [Actinomycetota bacterium]|nr:ferritin-like domain-containing protein [Actinomycetota bacterium]